MRLIAHISDVHILDAQARRSHARYRLATKFVSNGRAIDPNLRARKLARALAAAKASGAEHIVISGDLTELGDSTEFEHFAQILHEAGFSDESVTLVPGNHDAYTSPAGWRKALEGPLARFASSSASEPGKVVDRGPIAFLPIDTSTFQSVMRSSGEFTKIAAHAVEERLADPALRAKALVLVLHHPPFAQHRNRLVEWFDGLRGCTHVLDLLARHPRLQILHGHLHRVVDRIVSKTTHKTTGHDRARADGGGSAAKPRVFGAPAVCDDRDTARVRLYELRDGMLESAGFAA